MFGGISVTCICVLYIVHLVKLLLVRDVMVAEHAVFRKFIISFVFSCERYFGYLVWVIYSLVKFLSIVIVIVVFVFWYSVEFSVDPYMCFDLGVKFVFWQCF